MSKHITVKEVKDIVNSFSENADWEGMHMEEDDMYELSLIHI